MIRKVVLFVWLALAVRATAQVPNLIPATPLLRAVTLNDTETAYQLLAEGADPNEGRFVGFPPIVFPVLHQNLPLFRAMKDRGADIRARDQAGSSLLMWAAFDEAGRAEFVEELLALGLNPNDKDLKGDTALTWALRIGSDTPAVRALRKAGASNTAAIQVAVENALALLQKSGPQFQKISGCTSCHHQSLPQMANGLARTHGIGLDEQVSQQQVRAVIGTYSPLRDEMMRGVARFPNAPISLSYALLGLAAEGFAGDETTQAMAHLIASQQTPDGGFRIIPARPPLESSQFTAAALSLRAMQVYGKSMEPQIERAAAWLRKATPRNTEDRAMQLLGLKWANTNPKLLKEMAAALLRGQHEDGGWSQLPGLQSDAYATGQALVALERSGIVPVSDAVYHRGAQYLLRDQSADGSWLVHTRTFPVQPYKESGYPHGKNQWISAAGSSWAAMALSLVLPVPQNIPRVFSAF